MAYDLTLAVHAAFARWNVQIVSLITDLRMSAGFPINMVNVVTTNGPVLTQIQIWGYSTHMVFQIDDGPHISSAADWYNYEDEDRCWYAPFGGASESESERECYTTIEDCIAASVHRYLVLQT